LVQPLLGADFARFHEAVLEGPSLRGVRFHRQTAAATVTRQLLQSIPWATDAFYIAANSRLGKSVYHETGAFYIQEPSAMAVATALNAQPGERILDLCAAPGGKTTAIAKQMQGTGVLVANEIHPVRVKTLAQNLERLGVAATVTNETPARLATAYPGYFDAILVDAPCSGEGMFRKDPAAQSEWQPDTPTICAARQRDILQSAVAMLRPGGRLVYSTCTFNPIENEQIVAWLLASYPDFTMVALPDWPGWSPGLPDTAGGDPNLGHARRLWPHLGAGEGHFVAHLQRRAAHAGDADVAARQDNLTPTRARTKTPTQPTPPAVKAWRIWLEAHLTSAFVVPESWLQPILQKDVLFSRDTPSITHTGLKVLRYGTPLAVYTNDRIVPHHALAMRLADGAMARQINLDEASARTYCQGAALPGTAVHGFSWINIDGLPLGFGNSIAGRVNNLLPKGLRRVDLERLPDA